MLRVLGESFVAALRHAVAAGGFFGLPWIFWVVLAAIAWLAAAAGLALLTRARSRRATGFEPAARPAAEPAIGRGVSGLLDSLGDSPESSRTALRWVLSETEAEAAAYLELFPGGRERLLIEPQGLPDETVSRIAGTAREGLVAREEEGRPLVRWLGSGGTKCIALTGTSAAEAGEPLRFARYVLDWMESAGAGRDEEAADPFNAIPGVTWAERGEDELRVVLGHRANPQDVLAELRRAAPEPISVRWIDVPAEGEPATQREAVAGATTRSPFDALEEREVATEARIRLLGLTITDEQEVTADVRVTWRDQELRGRGRARHSPEGRSFATAQALADALRPLLDSEVVIEGLYSARTRGEVQVIIAEVVLEGQRLIGAVERRPEDPDLTGARAVLDAVNRRLARVAGRSGRI